MSKMETTKSGNRAQRSSIEQFTNKLNVTTLQNINYTLPSPVSSSALLSQIQCTHASIFISGNYQKVSKIQMC